MSTPNNTLGAMLAGIVVSSILYGTTQLQVFSYFIKHSGRDRLSLKSFVASLIVLDAVNMFLLAHTQYHDSVTNFGNGLADRSAPWSFMACVMTGIVINCSIQHFFAHKIYQLSKGALALPLAISTLSLGASGLGMTYGVKLIQNPWFADPGPQPRFAIISLALQVACDTLITGGMVYYLVRSKTGASTTNVLLNRLIFYSLNCGALNLVLAILSLAGLTKYPHTMIYAPFFVVQIRLYFCSLVVILNSRDIVHSKFEAPGLPVIAFRDPFELNKSSNGGSDKATMSSDDGTTESQTMVYGGIQIQRTIDIVRMD
ncbi:hypothetical protein BC834DRAFT_100635 [Gloeopeniophorella convolvens]|nr:hypothetical protein BC834DRAFT_100635 [Gloeopeniophorella convolvens]